MTPKLDELFSPDPPRGVEYDSAEDLIADITGTATGQAPLRSITRALNKQLPPHEEVHCCFERSDGQRFYMKFDKIAGLGEDAKPVETAKFAVQKLSGGKKATHRIAAYRKDQLVTHAADYAAERKARSYEGTDVGPDLEETAKIIKGIIDTIPNYNLLRDNCYSFAFVLEFATTSRLLGIVQGEEKIQLSAGGVIDFVVGDFKGELYNMGEEGNVEGHVIIIYGAIGHEAKVVAIFGDRKDFPEVTKPEKTVLDPKGLESFLKSEGGRFFANLSTKWKEDVSSYAKWEVPVEKALCRYVGLNLLSED